MDNKIFTNEFSEEVFYNTYMYENETVEDMMMRVSTALSNVEKDNEYWRRVFYDTLKDFKFVPGGRILSNINTNYKNTTLINCFVDGFQGYDQDSMESIMDALKRQALILKSEGGYGFCIDILRPSGSFISGIGGYSPGPVEILNMWDATSEVITSGSYVNKNANGKKKIRKGAMMATMSIWHPDIEKFVSAKLTPNKLAHFNLSVLITDDFMNAVENDLDWDLIFPDYEICKDDYKSKWDGNIKKWIGLGLPVKIYKTIKAKKLFEYIIKSSYDRNEPGVLFIDKINRLNNLNYCEYINATNPCGEQILPVGSACLLGSINLTQFINYKKRNWDYKKLSKYIPSIVRMLDNVYEITNLPLEYQYDEVLSKRRLGIGIMGYGSALMIMKYKYGSDDALKITNELMNFISNKIYRESSLLAKEKGAFPLFDKDKYLNGEYINRLNKKTRHYIKKYGLRNSHLISIQPTGNTSILANNVSGGLEPVYLSEYIRTTICNDNEIKEKLCVPTVIDFKNKYFEKNDSDKENNIKWEWIQEGDEFLLKTTYDNIVYKIDKTRGLLKEVKIKDYAKDYLEKINEWEENSEWTKSSIDLSIDDHLNTLEIITNYIDSSASKCLDGQTTMIIVNDKILYLDELDYDEPNSFKDVDNLYVTCESNKKKKIKSTYNNGVSNCIKITFDDNSFIIGTPNHKILSNGHYVELINLNKNQII